MELIIFVFCSYLNYKSAKQAGLSGGRWVLYTVLAIFGALFIGAMAILLYLVANDPALQDMVSDASASGDDSELRQYLQNKMTFLNQLFMFFCGIGGYLFIRYRLQKKTMHTIE